MFFKGNFRLKGGGLGIHHDYARVIDRDLLLRLSSVSGRAIKTKYHIRCLKHFCLSLAFGLAAAIPNALSYNIFDSMWLLFCLSGLGFLNICRFFLHFCGNRFHRWKSNGAKKFSLTKLQNFTIFFTIFEKSPLV